jgi:diguanylate cyclase (GGDEF)-like protein
LVFPKALEQEYLHFHVAGVRARVRVFFALAPLLILTQWLKGGAAFKEPWQAVLNIAFMACFLGGANWLAWSRQFKRLYVQIATPTVALLVIISIWGLPRIDVTDGNLQALDFVINVPLMTHLLLGLPFYRAVALNVAATVVFFISAIHVGSSPQVLLTFLAYIPTSVAVAALIAYTAERASRNHFLQEQLLGEIAARDPLTGLQNRASFDDHLEKVWKQGQRGGETVGLMMLDLDHFKACNDTLGHQAGDAYLRRMAEVLTSQVPRPLDLIGRYGGEEFVVVLFQTSRAQVLTIAEGIRAAVEALKLPNPGAPRQIVTVSIGAAIAVPVGGRSMHALIQMADEALYAAKGAGRNCVHASEQDLSSVTTGHFKNKRILRIVG